MLNLPIDFSSNECCSVIKNVLMHEKIVDYLHPTLKERSTLYLIKNEFCNFNDYVNNLKIITIEEKNLRRSANFIKITSIKKTNGGQIISLSYPIEGAFFKVHLDNYQKIIRVEVLEI